MRYLTNTLPIRRDVFVLRTGLTGYTADWCGEESYPESQALQNLLGLSRSASGRDLLTETIKPGDSVVIKPNLVRDRHPSGGDLFAVITHPAIIRAVVDRVFAALEGSGQIVIADAPMGDTDFAHLLAETGLVQIIDYYRRRHKFDIGLYDLRNYRQAAVSGAGGYLAPTRIKLQGDPAGYREVDLGTQSAFSALPNRHLLEGTSEGRRGETVGSHSQDTNRYLISQTALNADVLISVPKLKTHAKVGVTLNCKGMVGISGSKNRLPHFRLGSPIEGGDQFPDGVRSPGAARRMRMGHVLADHLLQREEPWAAHVLKGIQAISGFIAQHVIHLPSLESLVSQSGNWSGNDTCWRLAADLVRIAVFADRHGVIRQTPQRRFLSIVDGIVGGEGDGPLSPTRKLSGVLLAGEHPIAVDLVGARLMGFDHQQIRYLYELAEGSCAALEPGFGPVPPQTIRVVSNDETWTGNGLPGEGLLNFQAPPQWKGALELGANSPTATETSDGGERLSAAQQALLPGERAGQAG